MGHEFAPFQPTLFLRVILKTVFDEELRQSLLEALESFTILEFKIQPLESEDTQLIVELGTDHQPNTILTIIELVVEKSKSLSSGN